MPRAFRVAECVRLPDGRIGRVRALVHGRIRVRVRRIKSGTHQFLMFSANQLRVVDCPKGWMSPQGYERYLRITLTKMRKRTSRKGSTSAGRGAS
jgi:hypothetical protein